MVPRAPVGDIEKKSCDEGEQIWIARFYWEDQPAVLGALRPWLREADARALEIEASAPSEATWQSLEKVIGDIVCTAERRRRNGG